MKLILCVLAMGKRYPYQIVPHGNEGFCFPQRNGQIIRWVCRNTEKMGSELVQLKYEGVVEYFVGPHAVSVHHQWASGRFRNIDRRPFVQLEGNPVSLAVSAANLHRSGAAHMFDRLLGIFASTRLEHVAPARSILELDAVAHWRLWKMALCGQRYENRLVCQGSYHIDDRRFSCAIFANEDIHVTRLDWRPLQDLGQCMFRWHIQFILLSLPKTI